MAPVKHLTVARGVKMSLLTFRMAQVPPSEERLSERGMTMS